MRVAMVAGCAALLLCVSAGIGIASPPSPGNSRVPAHVLMVGRLGTVADTALGSFTVVVRGLSNNPIPGASVEVRLNICEGARVATDPLQPGVATRCDTHGVTAVTDIHGEARLALLGGGTVGSAPGTGPCASIFANGVLLGTASVAWLDLDGADGLGANDLSLWLTDYGLGEPISRSDFDGDGAETANDLSVWLEAWSRGNSLESASSYCL